LPGMESLRHEVGGSAALVATADLVHHGVGYGTGVDDQLPLEDDSKPMVRRWITESFEKLLTHRYEDFLSHAQIVGSDFRDTGSVLAYLLGDGMTAEIVDLELCDYSDVLGAAPPTWVSSALVKIA